MSISIDNMVIPEHLIELFEGSMDGVWITGKALEDEGRKIYDTLKQYKKGDTIQLKDSLKFKKSGIYRIDKIELSMNDKTAPATYSFELDLKYK